MTPFTAEGAAHFCQGFQAVSPLRELRLVYDTLLQGVKNFAEPGHVYEAYRDALLRESDAYYFLAVSSFRRALDLFLPSAIFWVHVSLYYSCWYAAHSILGLYGCWIRGISNKRGVVVEVANPLPNNQRFTVDRNHAWSGQGGSHQFFWETYYSAMAHLQYATDPALILAVSPIGNNPTWPIDLRNRINYQSKEAMQLVNDYLPSVDPAAFPGNLVGDLATQLALTRTLLLFRAQKGTEFQLHTDSFAAHPTRAEAVRELIYQSIPPNLSAFGEETLLSV